MKKAAVTLIIAMIAAGMARAQQGDTLVQYTPDFKFRDGIYLNFDMVKTNSPIPKAKLFTSVDYNDKDFFDQVISSEKIYFYDNLGVRQEIEKDNIWGFARNGVLYVKVQGNFNRITFFGSIIHFVADVTTQTGYNQYGYYDPYYSPYRSLYSPYYYSPYSSRYYDPYGYNPYRNNSSRTDLEMFMIDFETGKSYEYNIDNLEALLMKDPELYEEFVSMRNKNQKKMMFVYLRKFNERNPVLLPADK
jgi:hypothetical protein